MGIYEPHGFTLDFLKTKPSTQDFHLHTFQTIVPRENQNHEAKLSTSSVMFRLRKMLCWGINMEDLIHTTIICWTIRTTSLVHTLSRQIFNNISSCVDRN